MESFRKCSAPLQPYWRTLISVVFKWEIGPRQYSGATVCVWACSIDRAVWWLTPCVKEYERVSKCESVVKWVKWVILCVWENDSFSVLEFVSHYPVFVSSTAVCVCVTCQKCVSFEAAECWRGLQVLSVAGDWGGPEACPLPPVTVSVCGSVIQHSATSSAGCVTPTHTQIHSYLTMWSVNYGYLIPPDSAEHNIMIPSSSASGTTTKNSIVITNSSFSNTRNLNPAFNVPTNSHSRDKSRFYAFWRECEVPHVKPTVIMFGWLLC